jgi:hypothetical protein
MPRRSSQPRAPADIGKNAARDRVVGAEHRDPCREEDKSGHDRYKAANRAQDQKCDANHCSDDVPHISW